MTGAQISWLPDGRRLHLHHGPIDMIVDVTGPGRQAAFDRATIRFRTLLEELVAELPRLRETKGPEPKGETAQLMTRAVAPFAPRFVTPLAAVAGAGADTILKALCDGPGVEKAYVNNGGDVAFHLTGVHKMRAAVVGSIRGRVTIRATDPVRGIATSGWAGRSHSLGIADSATVLAHTSAQADAAATLLANAVNLPGHPAIARQPAQSLYADSDLGHRLITTAVGSLSQAEIETALDAGQRLAADFYSRGLILGAYLTLKGQTRVISPSTLLKQKDPIHA